MLLCFKRLRRGKIRGDRRKHFEQERWKLPSYQENFNSSLDWGETDDGVAETGGMSETPDKGTAVGHQVNRGISLRVISEPAQSSSFNEPDGQDWPLRTASYGHRSNFNNDNLHGRLQPSPYFNPCRQIESPQITQIEIPVFHW